MREDRRPPGHDSSASTWDTEIPAAPGMGLGSSEVSTAPRIFDCFSFNDELLLLEFRFRLLDSVVDRFVLVEADTNRQGKPKELHFLKNRDRYQPWLSRISHVVVRDIPPAADPWASEEFQRQAIPRGLEGAESSDIALVSDVDEIPNPATVSELRGMTLENPVGLRVRTTYFCVDLQNPHQQGQIPKACRIGYLADPQALRVEEVTQTLPDAGWHLAWLSREIEPAQKLEAFTPHTELDRPWFKSPQHARRCRDLGVDLFGRFLLYPVPWDELGEPIREFASANPWLIHGPRGPWHTFLARCYMTNIWGARFLPLWLVERHPIAAFPVAATLRAVTFPLRGARRAAARRTRRAAQG